MTARRAVRAALPAGGVDLAGARTRVDAAKRGLSERGPVWWTDGAPDLNRRLVGKTPYFGWFASLEAAGSLWGHTAGAASNPADGRFVNGAI